MVFATDVEGGGEDDERLAKFSRGADLLIHDSMYFAEQYASSKKGWGHSTPEVAADVAARAGVKQLVLHHHEPEHDDATGDRIEQIAKKLFPNSIAAFEGMEIELDAS